MSSPDRVYDLGEDGEQEVRRLASKLRLGNHLEPIFLMAKPVVRAEVERRLRAVDPLFEKIAPGVEVLDRVEELAATDGEPRRRVLWIEVEPADVEPVDVDSWLRLLVAFNRRREWLRERAPWLMILAVPPATDELNLHRLCARHAPDFWSISGVAFIDSEPNLMGSPPTRSITWLHLSDFHFASREGWDRRRTLKALLEFLEKRLAMGWSPDFIFATGDIAWSGRREEFEQAQSFFRELGRKLSLSEDEFRNRLFVIPGNHDVNREAIGPMDHFMVAGLLGAKGVARQELLAKTFTDAATMKLLGRRLTEYYLFTERQLGAARRVQEERPWRVDFREVAGVEVAILQLNTAIFSGPKDAPGQLLLGRHQVEEALAEASTARLRFVLQHHPFSFLADEREVKDRLGQRDGVHFLLRGHLHDTEAGQTSTPAGSPIELAAGAVYAGTDWPKRFLIGEADLDAGRARVEFFAFSSKSGGFWAADTLVYAGAPQGIAEFELPSTLRKLEKGTAVGSAAQNARARTLRARYRLAIANVHGQMRFIGLPVMAGSRPNVGVQELFVPLRLRSSQTQAPEDSMATAELLRRLRPGQKAVDVRARGRAMNRFVVLGEPGSGKTTLCRFAAAYFAKGESTAGPLPLFLPFQEYVRLCREQGDRSLLGFLVEQAINHLQVGIDQQWLEHELQAGDAVLLLDGLDGVGSAAERVQMRERVLAFCSLFPKLVVLVTSRVAGYDEAPLPAGEFVRLELLPFNDAELRSFVQNWYTAQEPNDPVARQRGSFDMLAALDAEPRVKALAGNPLLATLIALVHRSEARLTGERARLYEKVVQLLLETWPSQARRNFREIDEGLQRSYLESFALDRQKKRNKPEAEVSFRRAELVESLAGLHCQQAGVAAAVARRQVEQWVDYLAAGTGILVEQQPGVFAFLHLALLEFLASCALDREKEPLAEAVARLHVEPIWRETLLLAVGRHDTDLPFLDRLFENFARQAGNAWFFLLFCLREEAAFDAGKRGVILEAAGRRLLELPLDGWGAVTEAVRTIERFSLRHREGSIAWRESQLATAVGEVLRGVVALSGGLDQDGVLRWLNERRDRVAAATDLLEFWPGSSVGQWAVQQVDPEQALAFFESAPADVGAARALACFEAQVPDFIAGVLSSLRLRTTHHFTLLALESMAGLEGVEREGGTGLPPEVQIVDGPHGLFLDVLPVWFRKSSQPKAGSISWASRKFVRNFNLDFTGHIPRILARRFAQYFALDLAWYFARYIVLDFAQYFSRDFGRRFSHDFAQDFSSSFSPGFAFNFDSPSRMEMRSPVDVALPLDLEKAARGVAARLAGEAWISLATTAKRSREEAESYFFYRLQNLSLLYLWPAIDKKLPAKPSSEKLALYLELGWTQATTTHDWPGTRRWIALLKGKPPAHWLPRAHWYLCWLLYQPDATKHQEGFNAALREGLAETDVSLRAAAETLEREMGFFG